MGRHSLTEDDTPTLIPVAELLKSYDQPPQPNPERRPVAFSRSPTPAEYTRAE